MRDARRRSTRFGSNALPTATIPSFMAVSPVPARGETNEGTTWTPATFSAMAWQYLEQAGVPNVTGVWRGKWPELLRIQIRKSHRGHAQQVAAALWGCHLANYAGKHLIVVDDDIDIHDWEAIEWRSATG